MATKQQKAAPSIDAEALYKVELTRSVPIGRLIVNPSADARLRGDALSIVMEKAPGAVASFEIVQAAD